jgi:acyl-CoA synthetase (AMP-forming)/AMP-acid ligase II
VTSGLVQAGAGERQENVGRLLYEAAKTYPERIAVVFHGRQWSYRELNDRVNALALGLTRLGLKSGDRVVLWMKNCPQFIETMFACWKPGLVVVPVNARLSPAEVAFHVTDCAASALVYGADFSFHAAQVPIAHKINVGGECDLAYEDLAGRAGADEQTTELPEDAPAWLFYTSGTTGRPKGAVITHRNLVFVVVSWCADLYCLRAADVVLHCAPLSHGAGFHALTAVARGAQNLVHDRFDPDQVFGDIARYRVTTSWLVPTQVRMLLDSPALARADLKSVRSLVYGGAPMHAVDLTEAMTQFGPVLCQLYGQGESPMTISYLSSDEHRLGRVDQEVLSSAGVVRTGMEIRIADAQGTSLPVGEVGEITVRGPAVMTGYWNQPDATAVALRAGWLHTGDLGRLDERGHLYVLDRLKDFVITGGSNVYAREIEDLLLRHSAIREAAVFGVPDRLWGEAVTAAVVGADGLTPAEVIAFCRGSMADYKCPKHVYICPELPKNAYGKVLKRELRKRYADG